MHFVLYTVYEFYDGFILHTIPFQLSYKIIIYTRKYMIIPVGVVQETLIKISMSHSSLYQYTITHQHIYIHQQPCPFLHYSYNRITILTWSYPVTITHIECFCCTFNGRIGWKQSGHWRGVPLDMKWICHRVKASSNNGVFWHQLNQINHSGKAKYQHYITNWSCVRTHLTSISVPAESGVYC